jgi:hypothetical protein
VSDQEQMIDRAGIGDDELRPSESQLFKAIDFAMNIFEGIFDPNIMGLEKPVELVPRTKPEHAAQFVPGEMAALVFLKSKRLQRPPRQVAAGSAQLASEVIGNFYSQIHDPCSIKG